MFGLFILLQMQNKLNEERIIVRTLKEENSKTKNNLQQELLSQRQQLEMHIAHINEQHQQVDFLFHMKSLDFGFLFLIFQFI